MQYIAIVVALTAILAAIKYHRYRMNKAYEEGYKNGYTMAYFTKHTSPIIIRNQQGKRVNIQVTDHNDT